MTHSFPTRRSSDLNVNIGRDVICHQCGNSNAEIDVVAVTQLARGTRSHLVAGPSTRHTSSSRRRVVRFSTRRSLLLDRMTRSTKMPGVWMGSGSSVIGRATGGERGGTDGEDEVGDV